MQQKIGLLKDMGKEFKKFILRGNVIDLAVGIIVGAAFNKIVGSLVTDIITPPLGFVLGKVQFSDFYIALSSQHFESVSAAREAGVPVIAYGMFLDALIAFLLTGFAVFLLVKFINKIQAKNDTEPEKTDTTKPCPYCFSNVSLKATRCAFCTSEID